MLLAIDVGNTNTVFAVHNGKGFRAVWRRRTAAASTGDEYAAFLGPMLAARALEFSAITDVIVCSVVPDADFNIRAFCREHLKRDPVFITAANAGITVRLDNPADAGADRVVNAAAVRAHYKTPAVVIDFGTATTFDVIDAQGRYIGGAIAPGINLSLEALRQAAARLPRVHVAKPVKAIGTATVPAMQSGIYWGYIGLIEGLLAKITSELKQKPFVIATGGLAPLFATGTKIIKTVDTELTLKGLVAIHEEERMTAKTRRRKDKK